MNKILLSIFLLLCPMLAGAALTPEMLVNDAQKVCIESQPDIYHQLKSGWRFADSKEDLAKPLRERCPSGYQPIQSESGIYQLKQGYENEQLVLDVASLIVFLLGIWAGLKMSKSFNSAKWYIKLIRILGIIFVVLIVVIILRGLVLAGFFPCNYTMTC